MALKRMVSEGTQVKTYEVPVRDEPTLRGRDEPLITTGSWWEGGKLQKGYAVSAEKIRGLDEGELIALIVEQQPSELELRVLYGVWSKTPPTAPGFEEAYQRFATACRRSGWGLSPKAKAAAAAGREKRTMAQPLPTHERLAGAVRAYSQNNSVSLDEAMGIVLRADPALRMAYLAMPDVRHPAETTPRVDPASARVDQLARAYSKAHDDMPLDEATLKVLEDPTVRKDYFRPPPVFPRDTAATEQTQDKLMASLSLSDLLELCVARKLGDDKLARILVYDWVTEITGQEAYGSQAAADWCDAFWTKVYRERFKREGFGQPPGR